MSLKDWSLTAADNDAVSDATYGNISWGEGQNPNTVNDSSRAEMAHVRHFYENIEWRDWGHTPVYSDADTFTVASASDLSSVYTVGRRIRATDATTLYGIITASSYAASTQTVDVRLDSGSLSASLTNISLGFDPTNNPMAIPSLYVYRGTNQTHTTSAAWETVICGSEGFDDLAAHNTTTGLITVPTGYTWFKVTAQIQFDANATGNRGIRVVNGAGTSQFIFSMVPNTGASLDIGVQLTSGWIRSSDVASFFIQGYQNSGGILAMKADGTWIRVEFK